ncbi:MAG: hypothetical protein CSA11_03120 [Chloroflexi bacterium]|nr:MAG: hypothetical protein CSA11_03120 [Chloroflexota bacterium]
MNVKRKYPRISRWLFPGLLWLGLVLLFFNKMAFSNLILARGDTFLYFYPYWEAAAEALRAWRVPLWNDSLFMGVPLLANSQVGFFYPLNWFVWWLLPTPYAVTVSIVLHVILAGVGSYLLSRRALRLAWQAALLTAVFFALGGYFTAQVEHINQVQGLAWLPWLLWSVTRSSQDLSFSEHDRQFRKVGWLLTRGTAVAFFFALQLFAGHTQTTFISGVAVGVWLLASGVTDVSLLAANRRLWLTAYGLRFSAVVFGVVLAVLITAIQLLPTFELSAYSARQGGLPPNEVMSFSLNPLLLGRALLPSAGQSLFSEYVAFLPIVALVLAVIAAWQWRKWPAVFPALILAALGLFLAFGVFNPVYWILARLPGFNLFRVPARWLVLYGLGMALLAGAGFQMLWDRWHLHTQHGKTAAEQAREKLWHGERPLRLSLVLIMALMAWNAAAAVLTRFWPVGAEAPFAAPNRLTLLLWLVEGVLVYLMLAGLRPKYKRESRLYFGLVSTNGVSPWWLAGLALLILFTASRSLPYNNLTTPEAWFDLRPPVARLLTDDAVPPGRLLSLSHIFFDPGDQGEINSIYADQLDEAALYDYIVAIKSKEIVAPNLPLAYGLASVDGFDGGILPLDSYSQLMRLVLPDGQMTTDGRLREHLSAVPEAKWLDLFNGRYLITDKTADQWRKTGGAQTDVFFDLAHPLTVAAGASEAVVHVPSFPATALVALVEGEPGILKVETAAGDEWLLESQLMEGGMVWFNWPPPFARSLTAGDPVVPTSITFQAGEDKSWRVVAATLVNVFDGTFQSLTLGDYRLIYSGDVKIYENLDVLPRAFFVQNWQMAPDAEAALAIMAEPDFDPRETAVFVGEQVSVGSGQSSQPGRAVITQYEPERVVIQTNANAEGLLLLTDANFPGWRAMVDGAPVSVETVDILFRGVFVPAGEHELVFEFVSGSFENGRYVTAAGLFVFLVLMGLGLWKRPLIK